MAKINFGNRVTKWLWTSFWNKKIPVPWEKKERERDGSGVSAHMWWPALNECSLIFSRRNFRESRYQRSLDFSVFLKWAFSVCNFLVELLSHFWEIQSLLYFWRCSIWRKNSNSFILFSSRISKEIKVPPDPFSLLFESGRLSRDGNFKWRVLLLLLCSSSSSPPPLLPVSSPSPYMDVFLPALYVHYFLSF